MGSSTPDAPEPTAEQVAMEKRTTLGLEKERAKTERRLKAQARSQIGAKSLLTGIKPQTGLRQEDVEHSKAISSEELGARRKSKQRRSRNISRLLTGGIF